MAGCSTGRFNPYFYCLDCCMIFLLYDMFDSSRFFERDLEMLQRFLCCHWLFAIWQYQIIICLTEVDFFKEIDGIILQESQNPLQRYWEGECKGSFTLSIWEFVIRCILQPFDLLCFYPLNHRLCNQSQFATLKSFVSQPNFQVFRCIKNLPTIARAFLTLSQPS